MSGFATKCLTDSPDVLGRNINLLTRGDKIYANHLNKNLYASKNFTLSLWFKENKILSDGSFRLMQLRDRDGSEKFTVGKSYNSVGFYSSYYIEGPNGSHSVYYNASSKPKNMVKGAWHHVAVTFSKGTLAFYIDGKAAGKTISENYSDVPTAASGDTLTLGNRDDTDDYYQLYGQLDDARIYNRALNDADIIELYNLGIPFNGTVDSLQTTAVKVICKNLTTKKTKTVKLDAKKSTAWDCSGALAIKPGDKVSVTLSGTSQ